MYYIETFFIFILVIHIPLSILTYFIANSKGRCASCWGLACLVFSPIFFICLLFMSNLKDREIQQQILEELKKQNKDNQ